MTETMTADSAGRAVVTKGSPARAGGWVALGRQQYVRASEVVVVLQVDALTHTSEVFLRRMPHDPLRSHLTATTIIKRLRAAHE